MHAALTASRDVVVELQRKRLHMLPGYSILFHVSDHKKMCTHHSFMGRRHRQMLPCNKTYVKGQRRASECGVTMKPLGEGYITNAAAVLKKHCHSPMLSLLTLCSHYECTNFTHLSILYFCIFLQLLYLLLPCCWRGKGGSSSPRSPQVIGGGHPPITLRLRSALVVVSLDLFSPELTFPKLCKNVPSAAGYHHVQPSFLETSLSDLTALSKTKQSFFFWGVLRLLICISIRLAWQTEELPSSSPVALLPGKLQLALKLGFPVLS